YTVGGLSAHADRDALMGWLGHFCKPPRQTFIVHGESKTAQGFGLLVHKQLGWRVEVPKKGASYAL
ncbi:MAG: MBL fold metallo-hydrolase, partial [Halothiobacillaceae bacterium]